jgi:hypothetical protein
VNQAVQAYIASIASNSRQLRKLHDATVKALRVRHPLEQGLAHPALRIFQEMFQEQRLEMAGRELELRMASFTLQDDLLIATQLRSWPLPELRACAVQVPHQRVVSFIDSCESFMARCHEYSLVKLDVQSRILVGQTAVYYRRYASATAITRQELNKTMQRATTLLIGAAEMCRLPFQNAHVLNEAVSTLQQILGTVRYEEVSDADLEYVKKAMIGGPQGLRTHSGHWYKCQNNHPVSRLDLRKGRLHGA